MVDKVNTALLWIGCGVVAYRERLIKFGLRLGVLGVVGFWWTAVLRAITHAFF